MALSHGCIPYCARAVSIIILILFVSAEQAKSSAWSRPRRNVYTNDFVVTMRAGSSYASNLAHAQYLAKRHGFENHGSVSISIIHFQYWNVVKYVNHNG